MTQAPKQQLPWKILTDLPVPLETAQFVLEPLSEAHAELDYAAFMSCRSRLRRELQWGEWPPVDFTLRDNHDDLAKHYDEFLRRQAFAYTVLAPTRDRCLGCIYLERCDAISGAQLAFWVIDDAISLEFELVQSVMNWIHNYWFIERVLLPIRPENQRGLKIAVDLELEPWAPASDGPLANHNCFLSHRNGTSHGCR